MLNRLQDVFKSFQDHNVKYVIIGGVASTIHGVPRATFDVDILIEATPQNAAALLRALLDSGLATASMTTTQEILEHEITIFKDRVRIDVQTSTPGLTFDDAWEHKQVTKYRGQKFYVVSKEDLIASKRAAGRDVDLEDVRLLEINKDQPHKNSAD